MCAQGGESQIHMPLLAEGTKIRDTYEVERFLGEGAFAEVYRVNHKFLGRQAMKVFKQTHLDAEEVTKMLGEAILLSRIGHPNIVRVFDANTLETKHGTCGFFTMEYVPGGTLDKFWRSFGSKRIPIETCVDLMKQICRGLCVAHNANPPIIHRDIKPQNILVGYEADGLRARLSDFGLAKEVNPLTLLATAAGTLAFKPPEAFRGKKHSDSPAGDVFALGVTLYLLLTDELPFHVDSDLGWGQDVKKWKVPDKPSDWNVQVNPKLDRIVMKCIDFDPAKRFQNASELLAMLETWRPGVKTAAKDSISSSTAKSILGAEGSLDEEAGREMAKIARNLAKEGRLGVAADKMEEAFNQCPSLRSKYAEQVRLWRMGISM